MYLFLRKMNAFKEPVNHKSEDKRTNVRKTLENILASVILIIEVERMFSLRSAQEMRSNGVLLRPYGIIATIAD
jgi:hypothetical protein